MMTLVRKKKAEDDKNVSTSQDAKNAGFFRKNEKTPDTPPISTPDSSKSKEKVRPTAETIDVPSSVPTPEKKSKPIVKDDAETLERVGSSLSDLSGTGSAAAQDPPARMMRTTSGEAASAASSTSDHRSAGKQKTPKGQVDPPVVDNSIVTKVLGIVNLSCGGSTPLVTHEQENVRQLRSFQPEWGVAPEADDEPTSFSDYHSAAAYSRPSKTKRELAEVAAKAATVDRSISPVKSTPSASPTHGVRRHETFELVYMEPPAAPVAPKKMSSMSQWVVNKLKSNKKTDDLTTLGIARRDDDAKNSTTAVLERGGKAPKAKAPVAEKKKTEKTSPVVAEKTRPVVAPVIEPVEYQRSLPEEEEKNRKPAGSKLRKALSGKKNNKSKTLVRLGDAPAKMIGGNDDPVEDPLARSPASSPNKKSMMFRNKGSSASDELQQKRYKKVLTSIKGPSTITALETVHEETDENREFNVRVPGVQNVDSFISDKDLIGSEVVEEIYAFIDESIAKQELQQQKQQISKTKTVIKETTQIALETTPMTETPTTEAVAGKVPSANPVSRKSWKDRIGLKRFGSETVNLTKDINLKKDFALAKNSPLGRSGSGNEKRSTESVKNEKKQRPQWKAAVDGATGRTYYFHKKTRETTWIKPPNSDLVHPKAEKKTEANAETSTEIADDEGDIPAILKKKSPRDSDPNVLEKKQESTLTNLAPAEGSNVEKPVSQYVCREEEVIAQLHDLVDSHPFDEPVRLVDQSKDDKKATDKNVVMTRTQTGASIYSGFSGKFSQKSRISEKTEQIDNPSSNKTFRAASRDAVGQVDKDEKTLMTRTYTGASILSGFSGKLSQRSRISEKTEQIKNTSSSKPGLVAIRDVASEATSISSQLEKIPVVSLSPSRNRKPAKIPSNIPVPRLRELNVEEFTTSDRVYGGRGGIRRRKPARPGPEGGLGQPSQQAHDDICLVDNDDNDADKSTVSYAATDSISALSEADLSFVDRKEAYDDARRRALDRAIAQEDWDLAAQLSQGMRNSSKSVRSVSRAVPREWAQSEMDLFISENDWDAVAAYIAQIRADATEAGRNKMQRHLGDGGRGGSNSPRPAQSKISDTSGTSNPQKRFGARSQLQHTELASLESYSSYSNTYDSEYTSESGGDFYSEDERPPAPSAGPRQPAKEFAC